MPRTPIVTQVADEAGNRLGSSGTEVRIYDDFALTTLSTIWPNASTGATLAQPLNPNSGFQTNLTVAVLTTDAQLTVVDVSGFIVGNEVVLFDGTNTVYKVITAINAGTKVLTLDSAVGTAFAIGNTQVGSSDMIGEIIAWVDTAVDHYAVVKNVGSGRIGPRVKIFTTPATAAIAVQQAGVTIGTRPTLNFLDSASYMSVADNAGSGRVDLAVRGVLANDGTAAAPSIAFSAETGTGFWRNGAGVLTASVLGTAIASWTATAWSLLGGITTLAYNPTVAGALLVKNLSRNTGALYQFVNANGEVQVEIDGVTPAVNNVTITGAISGGSAVIGTAGASAIVNLNIQSKGTGSVRLQPNGLDALAVVGVAGAVNYLQGSSASTTNNPQVSVQGSDTNIGLSFLAKGTGTFSLFCNTSNISSALGNYVRVAGAASGTAPAIFATGVDANIDLQLQTTGSGDLRVTTNGTIWIDRSSTNLGVGAVATLGNIGGAGPAAAAQAKWGVIRYDNPKQTYFMPLWQ